jgi:recombinational DNA repair protein (RecF pathway)
VDPAARYHYAFDAGPRRQGGDDARGPVVRGATLIALAQERYPDAATAAEARQLMREVLDHHLESRRIESRRIVADLRSLDGDE